jgi:hypothetical protein
MFKRLTIFLAAVIVLISADNLKKNKKVNAFCNFKVDCAGLTPVAAGCISFGGAAGQCYWLKKDDEKKVKYQYLFDA